MNLLSCLCGGDSSWARITDGLRMQAADGHVSAGVAEQYAVTLDLRAHANRTPL